MLNTIRYCEHNGCGQPLFIQREEVSVWSGVCCFGHRAYIFKNDRGDWETQAQRAERLKRICTCPKCGTEHLRFDGGKTDIKCDDCLAEYERVYSLKKSRQDKDKIKERRIAARGVSSWHTFQFYKS